MVRGPKQEAGDGAEGASPRARQLNDANLPSGYEPWTDPSLAPSERIAAYKNLVLGKIEAILAAVDALHGDSAKQLEIRDAPDTQHWMAEATWLRGVSTEAFCGRMNPPLVVAEELMDSYVFEEKIGISTFTIPAGVTDTKAMECMNEYAKLRLWPVGRTAIAPVLMDLCKDLEPRSSAHSRTVTIIARVPGTGDKDRGAQGEVLAQNGLWFADNRDQALAAALYACKHDGEDLFKEDYARGSVPHCAVDWGADGVGIAQIADDEADGMIYASGSPLLS